MQEIATSSGKVLSLIRPDEDGKAQTVFSTEVFGVIRHLLPFRLVGTSSLSFIAWIVLCCLALPFAPFVWLH